MLPIGGRVQVGTLLQLAIHTVNQCEKVRSEYHDSVDRHAHAVERNVNCIAIRKDQRNYLRSAEWTGPNVRLLAPADDAVNAKVMVAAGPSPSVVLKL
jgi:hypothetical protein